MSGIAASCASAMLRAIVYYCHITPHIAVTPQGHYYVTPPLADITPPGLM